MPGYKSEITKRINKEDIEKMIRICNNIRDMCIIALLYLIPLRPSELLEIKKEDIEIKEDGTITLYVTTKKIGKKNMPKRQFIIKPEDTLIYKVIYKYLSYAKKMTQNKIFNINDSRIRQIIYNLSKKAIGIQICPYTFRHNRLTKLANEGASINDLMYAKGCIDIRSISPYLHGKPQKVEID